jgi:PRTRC genetic system protein E
MFKELLPLLEGRTMILTAAKIGDALTVTIYPKRNGERDENPVGNTPLCVTGTAEELDHELPRLILGYVETLGTFRSNLDVIKTQVAEASAAATAAHAAKSVKKAAVPKAAAPNAPPRADLFATTMPSAEAPEALIPDHDAVAAMPLVPVVPNDPRVMAPPASAPPPAAAPGKRATPIRGKAVETPPLPEVAAAPIPALAGDPIGMASEEDDFEPEPATTAKAAESVQATTQEMGWGDEDENPPVEVAAEDAGDDDENSCPF